MEETWITKVNMQGVSVIIPVYNAGQYVREAVTSALKIPEVLEVILIEDGSTDDSLDVCRQVARRDPKVILLQHEGGLNKGAGASRNLGIQQARGSYIAFLDSDDLYFENRFKTALQMMEGNSKIDGVYEFVLKINEATGESKMIGIKPGLSGEQLFRHILRGAYFHTNSITVRSTFLKSLDLFNQQCWPHEDVEMWLRMSHYGNLVCGESARPVATYRIHDSNNSVGAGKVSRTNFWGIVLKFWFNNNRIGMLNRLIILKQFFRWRYFKKK